MQDGSPARTQLAQYDNSDSSVAIHTLPRAVAVGLEPTGIHPIG